MDLVMLPDARSTPRNEDPVPVERAPSRSTEGREGATSFRFRAGASSSPVELPINSKWSAPVRHFRQHRGRTSTTTPSTRVAQAATAELGPSDRMLLTLVFTDIVSSTETLERLGDRGWCSLLQRHHELVRKSLRACQGCEVDSAGDGFFLVFDCPSRAVRFSVVTRDALQDIGLDVRVGIHAGECEVVSGRVEGVAVHTAARVANAATAGEILVSSTVKDLVAGSEHRFGKGEVRVLKGLSEPRQLFALECAGTKA